MAGKRGLEEGVEVLESGQWDATSLPWVSTGRHSPVGTLPVSVTQMLLSSAFCVFLW